MSEMSSHGKDQVAKVMKPAPSADNMLPDKSSPDIHASIPVKAGIVKAFFGIYKNPSRGKGTIKRGAALSNLHQ